MSAARGADHVDADDFVGLVVFDDLDEAIRVLDSLCPRDVLHLDSPTRTGAVFVHVLQFGRADGGDLRTGRDDRQDGVVVDGGPSSPNAFLTTWFALLGGDRLQFGLADDVARRVYVGICGLEALVKRGSPRQAQSRRPAPLDRYFGYWAGLQSRRRVPLR